MRMRARVRGTGNFARWLAYPLPLLFLGQTSYRLVYGSANFPNADPLTWDNSFVYFLWLIASLALLWRGAMLGVWVGEHDVLIRSWLSTSKVRREDIKNCRSMPYSGFLTRFTESNVIRMLGFRLLDNAVVSRRGKFTQWLSDFGTLDVRATIALAPFSYKQAARVTEMLGLGDPAADAPRHRVERGPAPTA